MAKALSAKSRLIRDAIKANPTMGNAELAQLINSSPARKEDKIEVTGGDVNNQKQALKAMGVVIGTPTPESAPVATESTPEPTRNGPVKKKPGKKRGKKTSPAPAAVKAVVAPKPASPADLLDRLFALAQECGGILQLKRMVDRIATA